MCVISEINDPSKEVKVRFMRKSGQYFLPSKKLEKWFPKSAIFHRCSIPSIKERNVQFALYASVGQTWDTMCHIVSIFCVSSMKDKPYQLDLTPQITSVSNIDSYNGVPVQSITKFVNSGQICRQNSNEC